jgi:hypothetical protein
MRESALLRRQAVEGGDEAGVGFEVDRPELGLRARRVVA